MIRKLLIALIAVTGLVSLTACWPFTTGKEDPSISISNATVERDFGTDLPTVKVDWDVHYPSDTYAQSTDVSIVCVMSQQYTSGPRSFTGAPLPVVGTNKDHYGRQNPSPRESRTVNPQGPATIAVPISGKHIKGKFNVTCHLEGVQQTVVSNTLQVTIPGCDNGIIITNMLKLDDTVCESPTPSPSYTTEQPFPSYTTEEPYPSYTTVEPSPTDTYVTPSPTETPSPTNTYDYDAAFAYPQWLVHATGHGTTSGDVKDDFYTLIGSAPDAQGNYLIPDGSGGTYGYSSDYNTGPLGTPRAVCTAAAGVGVADTQAWTLSYNYNKSFDCTGVY